VERRRVFLEMGRKLDYTPIIRCLLASGFPAVEVLGDADSEHTAWFSLLLKLASVESLPLVNCSTCVRSFQASVSTFKRNPLSN
jgi:hypothetical protein